jgi:predicted glycoside hydrolase/deacetylase ChbG (UPF0249 family)
LGSARPTWQVKVSPVAKRLILNADDLGYDPEVTRGILESMRKGCVTSTTLMVNTPHSEAAARMAHGLAVGLHLNLARFPPVSALPKQSLGLDGALLETLAGELPVDAVRREVLAQLDRLHALLGTPATHVDVHKHLHRHPNVLEGLAQAALARRLPVRALDEDMRQKLRAHGVSTTPNFVGEAGDSAYWTLERLDEVLATLPEGTTELMCHPGYRPSTLKSGYAAQREVELATFTSRVALRLLERRGIERITWAQVPFP